MLFKTTIIGGLFATLITSSAFAECKRTALPNIPDGSIASKEEVMKAYNTFKKVFQPSIKKLQNCIIEERTAVGDVATAVQMEEWDALFDAAYSLEEQMATKMNETIRAYKAQKKKSAPKKED